ncbi:PREDICTED: uncharacterized protein LOC109180091 isoform X1 [Ipomoea nil]|uniref:uncharacterized protein LOC109180091 isoform X1 n=1 Tax=Ipomoea nil TaxID=35883 RepID=UPI0009012817|nr:PREDICTED: uncharacterized protein LOC109180091 isoform X1 [Ipomoea nil]
MSWLRSAVNKAVEVGGKRKITRNLRSAVQTAGYAVVDGAKVVHDRSGPGNFKSFKHALKRLEEQSVSCRGIERLQQLRRWLVALKEIERLKEARVEQEKNNDPPEDISIAKKDLPREPTMVLYYDPDLGGEPMNFKDVFLRSQALEGIVLSVILEAPDEEEVSLLTEIFGLCLTGGKEVCDATIASIEALAKAFSSYNDELLAKKEDLLLFAQSAIAGLKVNADIARIDSEVSNIQQDLNKMECWPPSVEVDKRSSELSTATITEALKDELSQLQLCSKLESLLSKEKIMLNRNSLENHFQKVDKLKVLSASLSCSASRAEEHISESRVQKDGAVSFRISKGNEFSQLEKELTFEIDELGKQKDQLEAELKRVNTALISAHVHLRNAKEERDQFNEASNEILQHFQLKEDELSRSVASYRAEADVCDAFIYFLEDTRGFESSYINQKQKHVNEELERCEGYFVELVIRVLSAYKDELGPSVLNLKKLAEDLRGSEIPAAAPNGGEKKSAVDARRRLEEEYLKAETKLITAFSVVESIKKQFYAQVEGISRKDDENVRELFDNLSKIKEELESMQRPSLEVETSNRRGADKSSSKVAPESTQSLNPISPGSIHQTERQKSVRENLRRSLSMAIRQANDSVSFSRDDSSFTSHKPLRTKNTDPAAELSKLKMELELENSSKDHPFDEIDDWESDVIVKNTEYGE